MIPFIVAHKVAICAVAVVIIDQSLPFLPTKYDGIAETIRGLLTAKKSDAPA